MPQFKFRRKDGNQQDRWVTAEGTSFEDALQNWHLENLECSHVIYDLFPRKLGMEVWYFLVVWNEQGERFISRGIKSPLRRVGGVRRNQTLPSLQDLAIQAGLAKDDLDGPWEGEEQEWH